MTRAEKVADFIADVCLPVGALCACIACLLLNYRVDDHWFERSDGDGPQTACSRECIDRISKKTGKSGVVIPI